MNHLGLVLVLVALALVSAWSGGALILGAVHALRRVQGLRSALDRATPLALLLPLVAAAALAAAAVLPGAAGCHCGPEVPAAVHLCFEHPERSLPLLPFAILALSLLAIRLTRHVPAFLRRVRACAALGRSRGVITRTTVPIGNAFSLALPRPRIIVDGEWWAELPLRERRIVLAHECAHLRRGDPLLLELLAGVSLALPRRLAARALGAWRDHAEREADAAAARAVGDPTAVAALLVAMHRAAGARSTPGFAFQDGRGLEARVRALLDGGQGRRSRPDLGSGSWLMVGVAISLPLAAAEWVHVLIETLAAMVTT